MMSTVVDCAVCPQLWSFLYAGIRQGVCVPSGALGPISAMWEGIRLSPGMCGNGSLISAASSHDSIWCLVVKRKYGDGVDCVVELITILVLQTFIPP